MSVAFSARGVSPHAFALFGVSAIALGAGLASPAAAQCAPEPTTANGTTTCTGTDANGVRITTSGTTLRVEPSATVTNSGPPAISVDIPAAANSFTSRTASILVSGQVAGASGTGIDILSGSVPSGSFDSSGTRVAITVSAGGSVAGVNGIVVRSTANNSFGPALASVDNSGTINGTSGVALLAISPNLAGFSAITNRSGGFISAISGPVGILTNAGTIDGGSRSAFDGSPSFNSSIFTSSLTNSWAFRSASNASTIANVRNGQAITNSGMIQNSGTGAAISGDAITLTNSGTGLIRTAGSTAITAVNALNLTNTGRIDGNVVVNASQGFVNASIVDSTGGVINGGLTLGAGNDVLLARYTGSSTLGTGITGPINAGAGMDTIRVRFDADTEVTSPINVPASFERLGLAPVTGVTATLSPAFSHVGTVQVTGSGTLINRGAIQAAGPVLVADDFSSSPRIVNAGTITGTSASGNSFAITLNNVFSFSNEGTVNAAGSGVSFSSEGSFSNSGTITAAGTAVSLFGPNFSNSGTIRSTGGTGVVLSGSTVGNTRVNSGRIEGANIGLILSTNFVNTGTIASSGLGVRLDPYGVLENRAGAVISGGAGAIGPAAGSFASIFNAAVVNAGTINGNVSLASGSSGFFTNNRFFAERGGVLNGNLALGTGDYLVTELVKTGPGGFAGITGTVTASDSFLRLRVREDASASFAPVAGFRSIGYELFDNAVLTLTGSAPVNQQTSFAGTGTVDLTADIATVNQTAIATSSLITGTGFSSAPGALNIISRGNLSIVHNDQGMSPPFAVAIGGRDSFTNTGTITIGERATRVFSPIVAISGGAAVVNSGTISLDGGIGVRGSSQLTNSGSIVQAAGGATAQGVDSVGRVINSGRIEVGGTAVSLGVSFQPNRTPTLVNSGTIVSTGAAAVRTMSFGSLIDNQAGGSITGPVAIAASGGTVINAGAITGTVQLSFAPFGGTSFLPGTFVSAGGTVTGSVLFGAGDDLFLQLGETTGVTGRIVGGDGFDTFGRAFTTSSTVALGTPGGEGFEAELVQARGADTIVTLTAANPIADDVFVGGDGRIVNQAVIEGGVSTYLPFFSFGGETPAALGTDLVLAEFRNEGTIRGGFDGQLRGFVNTGSIGSTDEDGRGVFVQGRGDLRFDNAGQIATSSEEDGVELSVFDAGTVSFANSGTISGGVDVYLTSESVESATSLSILNTGSIATTGEETGAIFIETETSSPTTVVFENRGTISASGEVSKAVVAMLRPSDAATSYSFRNSGLIEANGGGATFTFSFGQQQTFRVTDPAAALAISVGTNATGTVVNEAAGRITATGRLSTAVGLVGGALDLTNDGVIVGTEGTLLAANDELAMAAGTRFLAGAVQTVGSFADVLRNRGNITGSIDLGDGDDRVENAGVLDGTLFLRGGDDSLMLSAGAALLGVADGGDGVDAILVDANGEGAFAAESFAGFESLTQTGPGAIAYSGTFGFDTIQLNGGTLRVAEGTSLATAGATAVTGSDGAERVELAGALGGGIAFAGGDDEFVEIGAGRASGQVDGGEGNDLYRLRLAADRTGISATTGFERLAVEGAFTLALDLPQSFETISLSGAGLDLRVNGFTVGEIAGSDAAERVTSDADLARVALGGGDDSLAVGANLLAGAYNGGTGADIVRLTNSGEVRLDGSLSGFEQVVLGGGSLVIAGTLGAAGEAIGFGEGAQLVSVTDSGQLLGSIDFGSGDDRLTVAGQSLSGSTLGGAGADVLRLTNAGEVRLAGVVSGFEQVLLGGSLSISGALGAAGEQISFGDGAQLVDVTEAGQLLGTVDFGAGDDRLTFAGVRLSSSYVGGTGSDTLRLTNGAGLRLDGSVTGFEQILLGAGELTVGGTLGTAGTQLSFGDGAQAVRLVQGGTLAGAIDLGAGDDRLTLGAGTFTGTASGGAGIDLAILELAGDRSLAAGTLTSFERLATLGTGALTLSGGAFAFERVESAGDLRIATGASLTAPVVFGPANNRFVIEGGFAGSVAGGAGTDTIELSGGSAANPIAFAGITEIEAFRMSGGFATLAGQGSIGAAELTGGRLVGLAGSVLTASTLAVRQDATFGSAGVFNGSLSVAGTLSPGASPGTMTVNGNVDLAGTSLGLFEITPAAQDKLVVNGALAISQGATLQLAASGQLAPGTSLDLITASGGITGSFTNVIKPDSLFGFLSQSTNRIQLLGQFRSDANAAAQVNNTIDYTNALLVSGQASPALLAAAPRLVGANGASDVAAFARIAPEAYASVKQAAVENGLTVAEIGRGAGFASRRDAPGLFTFGQFTADRRTLRGDPDRGTSRARFRGYGLLGGLGYQGEGWSLGAFGGYLHGDQRIKALGARSDLDGTVVGLHGRTGSGPLAVTATAAYATTQAATDRTVPDGSTRGRYDLDVWTFDITASYDIALSDDWALRPKIGGTLLVVDREGVQESGGSAFAAQVAGERDEAAFLDASLAVAGGRAAGSTLRPFASIGLRYQMSGRNSVALAGFGGGGLSLAVEGVERARVIGTGSIGIEADLAPKLTLFGVANAERGEDDRQESVHAGIRLAF
jgi:hypothetical protein